MNVQAPTTLKSPFLWVALDGFLQDARATLRLLRKLDEVSGNFGFKVNNDALHEHGAWYFQTVLPEGRRKFADTKMWNGARTMARDFHVFHKTGFDVVNVHALAGGYEDKKGKGAELKRAITMFKDMVHGDTKLRIYALTVLSHYGDTYCLREYGRRVDTEVHHLAQEAVAAGVDGIILPGTQLGQVTDLSVRKMTTGLRTSWYGDKEQEQEIRPADIAGRDDLEAPCGSPITKMVGEEEYYLRKLLAELQK